MPAARAEAVREEEALEEEIERAEFGAAMLEERWCKPVVVIPSVSRERTRLIGRIEGLLRLLPRSTERVLGAPTPAASPARCMLLAVGLSNVLPRRRAPTVDPAAGLRMSVGGLRCGTATSLAGVPLEGVTVMRRMKALVGAA
jgi:hypothetical protein